MASIIDDYYPPNAPSYPGGSKPPPGEQKLPPEEQKPPPEEGNKPKPTPPPEGGSGPPGGGGSAESGNGEGSHGSGGQSPPPPGSGETAKPPPNEGGNPPSSEESATPPPGSGSSEEPSYPPPSSGGEETEPPSSGTEEPSPPSAEGASNDCSCDSNSGGDADSSESPKPAGPSHPLNQLNQEEICRTVSLIKAHALSENISQSLVFASVSMKEPPKSELLPYLNGNDTRSTPARKAWSVFSPEGVNSAYEATINLDSNQVEQFTLLPPGTQPSFNSDDPLIIQEVVRNDQAVIERAQRAGVSDMNHLICDAWSYGYNDTEVDKENKRLMDMYLYARKYDGDNQYAHPLDFLVTVDMISKEVIDLVDLPLCPTAENQEQPQSRPVEPPQESHNYDPRVLPKDYYRNDVKPLAICQNKGPSFSIDGNTIKWQRWEMIIGFNFREGLTLHNISFQDGGNKRPVLYRAALSEMVVPYGDPRSPYYRKSAFDLGEYGLGYNTNSLSNGCDCLGEIRYMDFVYSNSKGEPKVTKNAICIHEEDAGLLQKHTEFRDGSVTIAGSRRLVISFIATVTNYDYLYYWRFYQDGTMEMNVQASGLLSVHSLGKGEECGPGGYGVITAPRINAPYHQHIFCARLDPLIDGPDNTVVVQEVIPLEAPARSEANPYGQGFTTRNTVLSTASESGTDTDPDLVRSWLVTNENVIHPYTKYPIAWKLVTPGFCRILASPQSGIYRRAGFARHNVWVTPYDDDQLYAAGKYINQAPGDRDGVNIWAERDNGSIRNTDIVLWHTFGLTHIPRVEDYPLMPVEGASFIFRPSNFFNANPALDVPQPEKKKCN